LTPIGSQSLSEEESLQITLSATDPDGEPLTFSASGFPVGASLAGNQFSWTPSQFQAGEYHVSLSVSDSTGHTDAETITITVIDTGVISPPIKAIYVWSEYYRILQYASEQAHFFDVCEVEGINTVYLQMDSDSLNIFDDQAEWYTTFIQNANDQGIAVDALLADGNGSILTDPQEHREYVEAVLKYNIDHPDQPFRGLNWDIENVGSGLSTETFVTNYANYMDQVETWSYAGMTARDQGLCLSFVTGSSWTYPSDYPSLAAHFAYIIAGNFGGSFDDTVTYQADSAIYCDDNQIPWTSGLQSDETGSIYTLYDLGKDAYYSIMSQLDTYYGDNYDHFSGFALHYYARSISTWNSITAVDWPSGTYQSGHTLSVPVTIQTSDNKGYKYRGVRLEVRDEEGAIHTTSRILLLERSETRTVTMEWQVPPEALSGSYDVKVTVYDLHTIYQSRRDPLYYIWDDFVVAYGLMAKEEVEDQLSLDNFIQLLQDNPDIFYGHGRVDPLYTDYKGWEDDLFSVS
jgi:hypothetical protein